MYQTSSLLLCSIINSIFIVALLPGWLPKLPLAQTLPYPHVATHCRFKMHKKKMRHNKPNKIDSRKGWLYKQNMTTGRSIHINGKGLMLPTFSHIWFFSKDHKKILIQKLQLGRQIIHVSTDVTCALTWLVCYHCNILHNCWNRAFKTCLEKCLSCSLKLNYRTQKHTLYYWNSP